VQRSSIFISVAVGFGVFTFLSLDILRELYGQSALLFVYSFLAILTAIAAYSFTEKITKITEEKRKKDDENTEGDEDSKDEDKDEVVEKEMKNLKEKNK
jgi:hypothetical protein